MRIKVALSLVLTALVALLAAGSAQAALTVTNQNDSGAGSLRQAVSEAPPGETVVVPAGTYTLTSDPLEIVKSVTIAGHGSGDTTIRAGVPMGVIEVTGPLDATISGVTIRDGNIASTVAEGAGIQSLQANLTLRDVVLTNNTVNANGPPGVNGGVAFGAAIWALEGSLTLSESAVTSNAATAVGGSGKNGGVAEGGGIWLADGPLTIANTTISGNRLDARGGQGPPNPNQNGGVAEGGGIWHVEGDLSMRDSHVDGNTALATGGAGDNGGVAEGGGLWMATGNAGLANTTFSGNQIDGRGGQGPSDPNQNGGVAEGGGIWFVDGTFNLSNGQANANGATATGGSGDNGGVAEGGGIWVASPLTTISGTSVSNNQVDARGGQGPANPGQTGGVAEGGGLWLVQEKPAASSSLTGSTFAGNAAEGSPGPGGTGGVTEGGGVWAAIEEAPLLISNSTIASNAARHQAVSGGVAEGGGLWAVAGPPGAVTLTSVTLAANRLEVSGTAFAEGGNLFWVDEVTIRNSIVANGLGPAGSENCSKQPEKPASLGFNLESLDQCGFHAAGDLVNRDPLLGPLQNNGGLTQTMAPSASSPAVDQGTSTGLGSDQRGVVRPIDLPSIPNSAAAGGDGSDIGAVEFQPSNAFTLGKLKRNKKKGTATLTVFLPLPSAGTLSLYGKGLKTQTATITGQGEVKLKVIGTRKIKKALRKRGRRKVGINVTYAPTGNSAATQSRKAKLVKKKRKHRKKHSKPGKR
jgi:hypothetical protein